MRTLLAKALLVSLVLALTLGLAACGSDSDSDEVDTTPAGQTGSNGSAAEPDTGGGADAGDGLVVAAGFPSEMPIAEGTTSVDEHPGIVNGYWGSAQGRDYLDVIAEFETALPASGWEIVERTQGVAVPDDMMFRVTGHGLTMDVLVEPTGGDSDSEDTLVSYAPVE